MNGQVGCQPGEGIVGLLAPIAIWMELTGLSCKGCGKIVSAPQTLISELISVFESGHECHE